MIELDGIVKRFGDKTVYDGFCARFEGITAVMGRSGCGKTTLLNIVASLTPYEGTVVKNGNISYMFQQPRLIKNLTVLENLLYVGAEENTAKAILQKVEVDGALYPKQLSGGMADRASLARAFATDGGTLLMDEPFRGLDIGLKMRIFDVFETLYRDRARDVLFVTHSSLEACRLAERAVIIDDGKIISDFSGDSLSEQALTDVLKAL